jgi:hypothetical protein
MHTGAQGLLLFAYSLGDRHSHDCSQNYAKFTGGR